jgi:hypothetical protein
MFSFLHILCGKSLFTNNCAQGLVNASTIPSVNRFGELSEESLFPEISNLRQKFEFFFGFFEIDDKGSYHLGFLKTSLRFFLQNTFGTGFA